MSLGIYLPTYKRADRLQDVASNIERATYGGFRLYFGIESDDVESIKAAKATGHQVVINKYGSQFGYSNTIQSIYEVSRETIWFHANDDFHFYPDWDKAAMKFLDKHPEVMVLGVEDGTPEPSFSTISFVRRKYIEKYSGVIDMPRRVFYTYNHNYVDTEFTYTAQARGVWAKLEGRCIRHDRNGEDETYAKNNKTSVEDAATFESRRHLWENDNLKENIMAHKLTDEEKKKRSEKMKEHWARKRDDAQSSPIGLTGVIEHITASLKTMNGLVEAYPDTIEYKQARDALKDAQEYIGRFE